MACRCNAVISDTVVNRESHGTPCRATNEGQLVAKEQPIIESPKLPEPAGSRGEAEVEVGEVGANWRPQY